jgi:phage terminase large subunit-like protein
MKLSQIKNTFANLSAQDRQALAEWAEEKARLMRADPLNHGFTPHPGQLEVHSSKSKEVLLVAANRFGKSVTGMREALWRATGTHPYKKVRPHEVIWCGFVDYGFYNKVTKRLFREWCPKDSLIAFHEAEKWAEIRRSDGGVCSIYFLSYEMGRESWQGGKVDFVWLDEELPEDIFREAYARVIDARGDLLLTQTPVSGLGWAYDEIYLPARAGVRKTHIVQGALAERDPDREYEVGESLVPHLDREQIVRFASIIRNPDERAIRIFGEFRGRSGGVYQYKPEIHLVRGFKVPHHFEVWGGVDPGYHGFAAVLLAMDPLGKAAVVGEYFSQKEPHTVRIEALWKLCQETLPLEEDDFVVFYCDTANPQDIQELNIWANQSGTRMVFTALGQGLKARTAGIQRVQEYLDPRPGRTPPPWVVREMENPTESEPMLYLSSSLGSRWQEEEAGFDTSRLIWELQRYTWKRRRRGGEPTDADEDSAGGAHMLAALRYAMMARLSAPEAPEEDTHATRIARHIERVEKQFLENRE